jgi:hypothetical protein
MSLCQYKNVFGEPGQGAHFHVGGVAVVDLALTVAGAYAVSRYFNSSFGRTLVLLLILGTFLHWLFCIPTAGLRALGLAGQ